MVEALAGSGLAGNSSDCLIELIEAGTELEPVADNMEIESEKGKLCSRRVICHLWFHTFRGSSEKDRLAVKMNWEFDCPLCFYGQQEFQRLVFPLAENLSFRFRVQFCPRLDTEHCHWQVGQDVCQCDYNFLPVHKAKLEILFINIMLKIQLFWLKMTNIVLNLRLSSVNR